MPKKTNSDRSSVGTDVEEIEMESGGYQRGTDLGLHVHPKAQLLYALKGLMQVTTPKGRWLVPPLRAVWVPPGIEHSLYMLTDTVMRTLYIDAVRLNQQPEIPGLNREFVVVVGALLRAAVLALFEPNINQERYRLLSRLVLLELAEVEDAATFIPIPSEARARRLAELVFADIRGLRSLEDLSYEVGLSPRTVVRLFIAETGLTFKKWRQRARIMAAVEAISSRGMMIKQVSRQVGYANIAAFSAAFHNVMGVTPTEFIISQERYGDEDEHPSP